MNPVDNKQLCRSFFEKVFNEGKLDTLSDYVSPDFRLNDPHLPIAEKGPNAVRNYRTALLKGFPDLRFRIDDQIAEGDKVVTFLSCTGTHDGEFFGVPASHKKATLPAIIFHRISGDKIVEGGGLWDTFGFLKESGAFHPQEMMASTR